MTNVLQWCFRRSGCYTLPLWIWAASPLFGDVTIRYESKMGSGSPQVKEQMAKMQSSWGQSSTRAKNGKLCTNTGLWTFIMDVNKQQMTLVDTEHKMFANMAASTFADEVAKMLPKPPEMSEEQKKNMPGMKTSVETKLTGRMETILGVQAEEREIVMKMEMSMPAAAGAQMPPMTMRIVMQFWTAKPEEVLRNAAIRELRGYQLWSNYFTNPAQMIEKFSANQPGAGDIVKMIAELSKNNAVLLRTHMANYMSMPPEMLKSIPENRRPANALDPNTPLFEMTSDAVELSGAAVEDSVFQIPADYKESPASELLKTMINSQMEKMGVPKK